MGTEVTTAKVEAGIVRDVDEWIEKRKLEPDGFTETFPQRKSTTISLKFDDDGNLTKDKIDVIKEKLEEARYKRQVAIQARDYAVKKRETGHLFVRGEAEFTDKAGSYISMIYGSAIATKWADAIFPYTKLGNAGVVASKIIGGWGGKKIADKINKDGIDSADSKIARLSGDELVNTKSGVSAQEVADWNATIKYWDERVKKYEEMLDKKEYEQLA